MEAEVSKPKRFLIGITLFFIYFTVLLLIGELVLRFRGDRPFEPRIPNVLYNPEFVFKADGELGYALKPGSIIITLCDLDSLSFTVTHNNFFGRTTSAVVKKTPFSDILILGGSFAYGMGMEDDATFPYLLQQRYPDLSIINLSTPGHGQVHSLIKLQQAVKAGNIPKLAIVTYSHYHDHTNTWARISRQSIIMHEKHLDNPEIKGAMVPYGRLNKQGELVLDLWPLTSYTEWPLRRYSALINGMENMYNAYDAERCQSHEVTKRTLDEIALLCDKHSITLLVVGIHNALETLDMLEYCDENSIDRLDISVDLNRGSQYRLHKHDAHPNPEANLHYASKLEEWINTAKVFSTPDTLLDND